MPVGENRILTFPSYTLYIAGAIIPHRSSDYYLKYYGLPVVDLLVGISSVA